MGFLGTGDQKRAQRAAEQAAKESAAERDKIKKKEEQEKLKLQQKFIRGIKGRSSPFTFFGDKLGGSDKTGGV